jgi:hypothetical protein
MVGKKSSGTLGNGGQAGYFTMAGGVGGSSYVTNGGNGGYFSAYGGNGGSSYEGTGAGYIGGNGGAFFSRLAMEVIHLVDQVETVGR